MAQNKRPEQFQNDQEWEEAIKSRFEGLHRKLAELIGEARVLEAKCDRYEAALKVIVKKVHARHITDGDNRLANELCNEANEALSAGEGEKEVEQMPFEDIKFMEECNLYPHVNNSVKVLTENDEGAWLEKGDLIKLSSILYRYANQKEDKQ